MTPVRAAAAAVSGTRPARVLLAHVRDCFVDFLHPALPAQTGVTGALADHDRFPRWGFWLGERWRRIEEALDDLLAE